MIERSFQLGLSKLLEQFCPFFTFAVLCLSSKLDKVSLQSSALISPTNKNRLYVKLKASRHANMREIVCHQIEKENDTLQKEAILLFLNLAQ